MTARRAYIDTGFGERRGVVLLDGRPERLILERGDEAPADRLGARLVGRVASIDRSNAAAFVELAGSAQPGFLDLKPDMPRFTLGQAIEVEVRAEARAGKGAALRFIALAEGAPRVVEPGPGLEAQLFQWSRSVAVVGGAEARDIADLAEAEALETLFPLPGGGALSVEPTRALVAVDVDLGSGGGQQAKTAVRRANLAAMAESARILRLKGLGGLVVIDLVGRGHDGPALTAAARTAFAPDNPGVVLGPIGRFGTLELALPRRRRPVIEQLQDPGGRLSASAAAMRIVRALAREGQGDRGARLTASAPPEVVEAAQAGLRALAASMGGRFAFKVRTDFARERFEIAAS